MTMMQKMQAKKSKKGFTLVELVIVIAILAILAAIAIPVITTTINSSKLSTLDSDKTTVDMVLKEAVNTYKASIDTTTYNSKMAKSATVSDVFAEQDLDLKILESQLQYQTYSLSRILTLKSLRTEQSVVHTIVSYGQVQLAPYLQVQQLSQQLLQAAQSLLLTHLSLVSLQCN